jgi:hypothetical protein
MGLNREAAAARHRRPGPPLSAGSPTSTVEHIVVLMLENARSFCLATFPSTAAAASRWFRPDLTNRLSGENIVYHPSPLDPLRF